MAPPVILQMNVHCDGCARKIRRSARNVYGVDNVWASPETGVVVVTGNADAAALRSRIEYTTRRPVTIVSDGAEEAPENWLTVHLASPRHAAPQEAPYNWRMAYMAPSRHAPPPQGYPPYVGMVHLAPPLQYAPQASPAYAYGGGWHGSNHWAFM